jgi:hypothetical protein
MVMFPEGPQKIGLKGLVEKASEENVVLEGDV